MTSIVSFDPGMSTGIFLYLSGNPDFEYSLVKDPSGLKRFISTFDFDIVICERLPTPVASGLGFVVQIIKERFDEIYFISPGEWKPLARTWKHPTFKTEHEKDAYFLMRYWSTFKRKDFVCGKKWQ